MRDRFIQVTSSLAALLSGASRPVDDGQQVEVIRRAILDALNPLQERSPYAVLRVRNQVDRADEVLTLWYLRTELADVIAIADGETTARRTVEGLTPLFSGHIPPQLMPRRTSLRAA